MANSEAVNEKTLEYAACVEKSARAGTLVNVIFHSSNDKELLKAKGTLKKISGSVVLQIEKQYTEGRVAQENIPLDKITDVVSEKYLAKVFSKSDLNDKKGSAMYLTSSKGKISVVIKGELKRADYGNTSIAPDFEFVGNNKEKNHVLKGDETFLKMLDVSDVSGRIHDKKQPKFRQICRFSEYIIEACETLVKQKGRGSEIFVCDLCCGKSYLSFAAYHCLTEIMGFKVKMACVDLKQSVIDYCAETAKKCGFNGMSFMCMDINDFEPDMRPDMVISLHACDIATDIVLNFAAKHGAEIILSTPCCHHEMKNGLDCEPLGFIASRPVLKAKLCDAATDALRLLKLEAEGYKVDATEFIDPEDTPKNVMLRAFRRHNYKYDSDECKARTAEYERTYQFLYGKSSKENGREVQFYNK